MTRFAIDPATLVLLVNGDHAIRSEHQLVAPNSIRSLALTILLHRVRDGELSDTEAMKMHERMTELKIRLLGDRVSRRTAWQIAREHNLTTIEMAEYVAVTKLQADFLVASNPQLATFASGLVPLGALNDLSSR